jgi:hypothetical protein
LAGRLTTLDKLDARRPPGYRPPVGDVGAAIRPDVERGAAGFELRRVVRTPTPVSVIEGRPI